MRIKLLLIISLSILPSVTYGNIFTNINIGDVTIKYNSYDISGSGYTLRVAISQEAQDLRDIARENNAISAINGVFFCPADYKKCNGQNYTINERFQNGEDLSFYQDTGERGVFAWDKEGLPFLFKTDYINPDKRGEIYEGMGNFPILLSAGVSNISYYDAIGLLDTKMKIAVPRHFICSNQQGNEILFGRTTGISLENLANLLPEIGCYNALNLDAGLSSHYIHNGRDIINGKRDIIDAFIIVNDNIDTQELEISVEKIMKKYFNKYSYQININSIKILEKYKKLFIKARTNINAQYTEYKYDSLGEEIGYTIDVGEMHDLKRLYIIESLIIRLNEQLIGIKEKIRDI